MLPVFPERVGRVIIDGVVNPHLWSQEPLSLVCSHFILLVVLFVGLILWLISPGMGKVLR